jgi:8-oxo-dGTP pyrophosphatase MutT (NUDIX family)
MFEWWLIIVLGTAGGALVGSKLGRRSLQAAERAAWEELGAELERARRYERTFQLARVEGSIPTRPTGATSDAGEVRRTDRAWRIGDALYVLLPESEGGACEGWTRRLQREHGVDDLEVRTVCFPRDGLTMEALLDHLGVPSGSAQPEAIRAARPVTGSGYDQQTQVAS